MGSKVIRWVCMVSGICLLLLAGMIAVSSHRQRADVSLLRVQDTVAHLTPCLSCHTAAGDARYSVALRHADSFPDIIQAEPAESALDAQLVNLGQRILALPDDPYAAAAADDYLRAVEVASHDPAAVGEALHLLRSVERALGIAENRAQPVKWGESVVRLHTPEAASSAPPPAAVSDTRITLRSPAAYAVAVGPDTATSLPARVVLAVSRRGPPAVESMLSMTV